MLFNVTVKRLSSNTPTCCTLRTNNPSLRKSLSVPHSHSTSCETRTQHVCMIHAVTLESELLRVLDDRLQLHHKLCSTRSIHNTMIACQVNLHDLLYSKSTIVVHCHSGLAATNCQNSCSACVTRHACNPNKTRFGNVTTSTCNTPSYLHLPLHMC